MKFINKHFVSRQYYEGACAYYQKAITRLTEENKLYETKLSKITECAGSLKTAMYDYDDDMRAAFSKMANVDCNLRNVAYKLWRILDDHEML